MRGLRTIPVLLDVCRDLESSARRAAAQLRQPDGDAVLGGAEATDDPHGRALPLVRHTGGELAADLGPAAAELD
jgi:hypothetical protein